MYVILVYDIKEDRVNKVLKCCRKYLNWIQNSVFEGEITEAKLEKLKSELKGIIKLDEDAIMFYILRESYFLKRESLGLTKNNIDNFV
ncbi:MAG: CRISPR-associated endonuclease Cas2 [Candidatus Micrarchaeia archaeon]